MQPVFIVLQDEEKFKEVLERKALIEKDNAAQVEAIKKLEEKLDVNKLALSKKDKDIDDLQSRISGNKKEADDLSGTVVDLRKRLVRHKTESHILTKKNWFYFKSLFQEGAESEKTQLLGELHYNNLKIMT